MSPTLVVLAIGQFTFVTSVFIVIGILPQMGADFRLPISTVAQAVGLFSIVYAISGPVLSTLAGTLNRRWLLIGVVAAFTVTNVIAALVTDFDVLLAMRLIGAACDGFYAATATAIAAATATPDRRGRALSIVNSGITIAFVVGIPLGTYLGYSLGWRAAFWFLAVLGALTTSGLVYSLPHEVRLSNVTSLAKRAATLIRPGVIILICVTIFSYAGLFAVYTYLAPALKQITGIEGSAVSSMLLLFGISTILGNWAGGFLTDLWSPSRTMLIGFVALAALLAAFPMMMGSVAGAMILVSLLGFIHYTALTPLQHRFTIVHSEQPDVAVGLCFASFYLGIGAASYLGGYMLNTYGIGSVGYGAAIMKFAAAAALVVSLLYSRVPERTQKLQRTDVVFAKEA